MYNEPKTDYAYSTLTDDYVKKLYNQISDNIDSEYEPSFYAEGNLSEYQITQAVEAYKNDHPEVFWLKSYYEYENFDYETGIWLTYTMSGDKLVTAKKSLILQLILFPKVSLMALNVKEKNIYIII